MVILAAGVSILRWPVVYFWRWLKRQSGLEDEMFAQLVAIASAVLAVLAGGLVSWLVSWRYRPRLALALPFTKVLRSPWVR